MEALGRDALTHWFPMHTFFTPCKHQKNLRFSDVFRVEERCIGKKWVNLFFY